MQWFVALFAHTMPLNLVQTIWTYLFTQRVEFLFFITLAILKQKLNILLSYDLNTTLAEINGIAREIDSGLLIQDAFRLLN